MKILDGRELADYIKERQFHVVRELRDKPQLVIVRDSDNPVIMKYVNLKMQYGEDIGVKVIDAFASGNDELHKVITKANANPEVSGIIVQLPLLDREKTDEITSLIAPEKDVDGLTINGAFDSATATAINWLLAGYGVDMTAQKIAIVGKGKLVGAPLLKMWKNSGFDVTVFHRGDDLSALRNYSLIVSATGIPHLIKNEMVAPGAIVVDAGTASEGGVLVGDVAKEVRDRNDLTALTPRVGGVGPLTVTCLFEHVIEAKTK